MPISTVAEIQRGRRDSTDAEILTVYAKVSGLYAIYKTAERVVIHFADDPAKGAEQRQALVPLNPLLGEINGLVDGWRIHAKPKLRAKANIFDRRVADALLLGLQGHAAQALPLLKEIKEDLLEERTSPARVDYVVVAGGAAIALILVAAFMTSNLFVPIYAFSVPAQRLWLGFGAGAVGALFFTCTALRTRQILTDLQPWENRADAVARILVGAIAGAVIVGLLQSRLLTVTFGTISIPDPAPARGAALPPLEWVKLAVAAFVAGFSERLIPGVVERAAATAAGRAGAQTLVGSNSAAATVTGAGGAPSETNPLGRNTTTTAAPATAQAAAAAPDDAPREGDDVDACGSDVEPDPAEATSDVELPAATGGVEEPEPETQPADGRTSGP